MEKKYPSWLNFEEHSHNCLFCHKHLEAFDVKFGKHDGKSAVVVRYVCNNNDCEYLKFDRGQAFLSIAKTGGLVGAYKEHLNGKVSSVTGSIQEGARVRKNVKSE